MQKIIQNLEGEQVQQMRLSARNKFLGFLLTVPNSAKQLLKDALVFKGVSGSQSSYFINKGEALVFLKDEAKQTYRLVDRIGSNEFCLIPFEEECPRLSVLILRNTTFIQIKKDSLSKLSNENAQLLRACLQAQKRDYLVHRKTDPQVCQEYLRLLNGPVVKLSNQKSTDPFSKKKPEQEASGLVKMRMILNRGKSREDVEMQLANSTKANQLSR